MLHCILIHTDAILTEVTDKTPVQSLELNEVKTVTEFGFLP